MTLIRASKWNVMSVTNWQTLSMTDRKMDIIPDQVMGILGAGSESSPAALVEGSVGGRSLQGRSEGRKVSIPRFLGIDFQGGCRYDGDD